MQTNQQSSQIRSGFQKFRDFFQKKLNTHKNQQQLNTPKKTQNKTQNPRFSMDQEQSISKIVQSQISPKKQYQDPKILGKAGINSVYGSSSIESSSLDQSFNTFIPTDHNKRHTLPDNSIDNPSYQGFIAKLRNQKPSPNTSIDYSPASINPRPIKNFLNNQVQFTANSSLAEIEHIQSYKKSRGISNDQNNIALFYESIDGQNSIREIQQKKTKPRDHVYDPSCENLKIVKLQGRKSSHMSNNSSILSSKYNVPHARQNIQLSVIQPNQSQETQSEINRQNTPFFDSKTSNLDINKIQEINEEAPITNHAQVSQNIQKIINFQKKWCREYGFFLIRFKGQDKSKKHKIEDVNFQMEKCHIEKITIYENNSIIPSMKSNLSCDDIRDLLNKKIAESGNIIDDLNEPITIKKITIESAYKKLSKLFTMTKKELSIAHISIEKRMLLKLIKSLVAINKKNTKIINRAHDTQEIIKIHHLNIIVLGVINNLYRYLVSTYNKIDKTSEVIESIDSIYKAINYFLKQIDVVALDKHITNQSHNDPNLSITFRNNTNNKKKSIDIYQKEIGVVKHYLEIIQKEKEVYKTDQIIDNTIKYNTKQKIQILSESIRISEELAAVLHKIHNINDVEECFNLNLKLKDQEIRKAQQNSTLLSKLESELITINQVKNLFKQYKQIVEKKLGKFDKKDIFEGIKLHTLKIINDDQSVMQGLREAMKNKKKEEKQTLNYEDFQKMKEEIDQINQLYTQYRLCLEYLRDF